MFSMKDFRQLIPYRKVMDLLKSLLEEDLTKYELFKMKKSVVNIGAYIAQSQGTCFYPKTQKENYKKAIDWVNKADRALKELKLDEEKKKEYKNTLLEIRKILIVLRNKVKEEDYLDEELD